MNTKINEILNKIVICIVIISIILSALIPNYSLAKTGAEIMNELGASGRLNGYMQEFDDDKFNEFVNKLKAKDPQNSVEVSGDKLVINVTSEDDLKNILREYTSENGDIDSIAGNIYENIEVKKASTIPNEENPNIENNNTQQDNRTEEEKLIDQLVNDYGMSKDSAKLIVENGRYRIDDDGTIKVTANQDELLSYGVGQNIISSTDLGETGEANWDIGGILLKPVFFLFNAIADSIMAVTQKLMYSDQAATDIQTTDGNYLRSFKVVNTQSADEIFDAEYNKGNYEPFYLDINSAITMGVTEYSHIHYSPEEIFAGDVSMLSIDFISGKGQGTGLGSVRKVISQWYKTLRLIAIIGFLSVLIYTGIRIIMSSNAKDKAKYKEWIVNWFIGIAILFSLHYLMAFVITLIDKLNELLSAAMPVLHVTAKSGHQMNTNLIGLVRFCTQYDSMMVKIGYEVMYIMLVVYTLKFTMVYLKRVLTMAFLTLIAPLVALMYPIDKLSDGKAEGFETWIKDYIFNALLQPMHLLLYFVLVSSAATVAAKNPIYGIAVLTFMTEGERLLKKIFGFEKAKGGTVGGMDKAFAGAALASSFRNLLGGGKKPQGGDGGKVNFPGKTEKDLDNELNAGASATSLVGGVPPQGGGGGGQPPNPPGGGGGGRNGSQPPPPPGSGRSGLPPTLGGSITPRSQRQPKTMLGRIAKGIDNKTAPVRQLAKNADNKLPFKGARKGIAALGKRAIKPFYDMDHNAKYNGKRFIRNVARGGARVTLGVGAAAIQAGISLTDGKYSASEAMLAFGAGSALGGRAFDGVANTFSEGYNSSLDKPDRMEAYKEDFRNRDDVIDFCKQNCKEGEDWKDMLDRITENYVPRGYTDLSEIKQCMKYSDKVAAEVAAKDSNFENLSDAEKQQAIRDERDRQDATAMAIKNREKTMKANGTYGAVNSPDKERELIASQTEGENESKAQEIAKRIRNENAAIRYFHDIVK